jgi:hypothetical protein
VCKKIFSESVRPAVKQVRLHHFSVKWGILKLYGEKGLLNSWQMWTFYTVKL